MLTNLSLFAVCAFGGSIILLSSLIIARRRVPYSNPPYPPGPRPLPVIGNVMHISINAPWLAYTAWQKVYGDFFRVRLMGLEVVVVNSEKTARAMLDQRSIIYSDRPVLATNKFYGVEWNTVMLRYGSELRSHRKIFHHALQADSSLRQREIYLRRARTFLASLLNDPQGFEAHIQGFIGAIIMGITYGYEMQSENDPYVSAVAQLAEILSNGQTPERAAILSAFPFLAHIPAWFPGAKFKRDALYSRRLAQQVLDAPFEFTKLEIAAGTASQSMVSDCLAQIDEKDDREAQESAIKAAAATAYLGESHQTLSSTSLNIWPVTPTAGIETSSSMLHAFILAMVLYPEVQAKAQSEIDAVIGSTRLPCFEDRPSLPYVEAILREMLRWNPALPLGIPHATSSEDIFQGYLIPKGTWVIINSWAMSRDEEKYPDPDEFRPERHFGSDGSLNSGSITNSPVFGFGRRICPGRFATDSMMWAAIVSILATFRIEKARDVDGREIDVKPQFTTGITMFVDDVGLSGFASSSVLQKPCPFPLRICVSFCTNGEDGQRRQLTNP
ncbi:cytochrome P450 [Suillus clintonianus]|uniref:cytochrome P450 n=1 Tax=Suillus clintonianus TaxID=1904413 RepID=UPI001B863EA5|nr:cytochrome P450 [Suillus clintonianus]KAG2150439.1 cytochrome P450 [Suillus clintonianus]